jgi:hypothetical protein
VNQNGRVRAFREKQRVRSRLTGGGCSLERTLLRQEFRAIREKYGEFVDFCGAESRPTTPLSTTFGGAKQQMASGELKTEQGLKWGVSGHKQRIAPLASGNLSRWCKSKGFLSRAILTPFPAPAAHGPGTHPARSCLLTTTVPSSAAHRQSPNAIYPEGRMFGHSGVTKLPELCGLLQHTYKTK